MRRSLTKKQRYVLGGEGLVRLDELAFLNHLRVKTGSPCVAL